PRALLPLPYTTLFRSAGRLSLHDRTDEDRMRTRGDPLLDGELEPGTHAIEYRNARRSSTPRYVCKLVATGARKCVSDSDLIEGQDRKSTRLNSSHGSI